MKIHVLKYVPHSERSRDKTPNQTESPRHSVENLVKSHKPKTADRSRYSLKMQTAIDPTSPTAQPTFSKTPIDPLGLMINQYSKGEEEIKTIQKKLEKIPFFASLEEQLTLLNDKEAYHSLIRSLKYLALDSGNVVFKEKGVSDGNIYIVHTGSVGIFTKSMDKYMLYHPKSTVLDKETIKKFNINFGKQSEEGEEISDFQLSDLSNDMDESLILESCNKIDTEEDGLRIHSARKSKNRLPSRISKRSVQDVSALCTERSIRSKKETITQITQNDSDSEGSPKNSNLLASNINFLDRRGSEQFMITTTKQRSSSFASINRLPIPKSAVDRSGKKPAAEGKHGKFMEVITYNNYFGERALQSTQKRYMTALALEDTRLIVLNAEDLAVAKKILEKKRDALLQFISCQFPFLATLPPDEAISHITSTITEKTMTFKNNVTTEGQKEDYFYLLYEGECELLRYISVEENDPFNPLNGVKNHFKKPMTKEIVKLCNLQKGNFIGEEIIFSREAKYYYTCRVTTYEAKLLAFHKTKFMMKFSREIILELKRLHEAKQKNYTNLFSHTLTVKGLTLNEGKFLENNQVEVTNNRDPNSNSSNVSNRNNFIKSLSSSSFSNHKFDLKKFKNSKIFRRNFEIIAKAHIEASRSSKSTTPSQGAINPDKPKVFFHDLQFERIPLGQIKDPQNTNNPRSQPPRIDPHHHVALSQSTVSSPVHQGKQPNPLGLRTEAKDLQTFITPVISPVAKTMNDADEKPVFREETKLYARKTRYNTENAKSPKNLKFSFDDKKDKIAEAKERIRQEKNQENRKSQPMCKTGLDQVFIKFLESKVKEEKLSNEHILKAFTNIEMPKTNHHPFLEITALKGTKKEIDGSSVNIHTNNRKSAHKLSNPFLKNNRTDVLKVNNENVLAADTIPTTRHPMSASIYKTSQSNPRKVSSTDNIDHTLTLDRAVSRA